MEIRDEDKVWAEGVAQKILAKERSVAARNKGRIPYMTKNHRFNDQSGPSGIAWWTNGFWGGMMWQLWNATKEEIFRENALFTEEKMDAVFLNYNGMDHDSGFRWLPTSVVNYRLTGDGRAKNRGLLAAANLAGRYNGNGNFIRAWNDWGDGRDTTGWAIIDCMMNLPLLYWASDVLGDPRFSKIAREHAWTAKNYFVREDHSARHIVGFNPVSGAFDREYGGQGMGEGSSWTRGQGWALYGFALTYLHTGDEHFLETTTELADHLAERIPKNGIVPVDFDQPADLDWQDGSAATILACGFLTLADILKENGKATRYRETAIKLLRALDADGCDYEPEHDELLTKCSVSYHEKEHNIPLIYADYYYIEAIWKLTGREVFIW